MLPEFFFGAGSFAKVSRDGKGLRSVAKIRAGMNDTEVASLGSIFKDNDSKLQAILKACGKEK
ncbi:hypothetical protein N7478_009867 [Penicillium angulare]|uniref:uncharacterized protein n=1 Tax=Penicillium angulare TaxID=116970 RepID=UPI00253FAB78|nr:uncharacterized protein N7478_009867 [Penicillium angulare]KAJ5267059.1 hypothetical protein N7478_009867 [Penicillium angulare]